MGGILGMEKVAASRALSTTARLADVSGKNIMIYVNNNSTLFSVARSASRNTVNNDEVMHLWLSAASLGRSLWRERVGSSFDPADLASRTSVPRPGWVHM